MTTTDLASPPDEDEPFDPSRESHHRISNQLAMVAGMIRMQASSVAGGPEMLPRAQVRLLLREIAGKLDNVAHLHRKLAHQADIDRVELGEFLIECCSILAASVAPQGRVGFVRRLDKDCFVDTEHAQSIGVIVNEIVTNAVKHAHPTGIPVEIRIACRHAPEQKIEIEIQDDGIGLPEGFDWQTSDRVGFKIIRSLATALGAVPTLESDSLGTSFRISVAAAADV